MRSKIPEIIRRSGCSVETHRAETPEELNDFLTAKLMEEVTELLSADSKDEVIGEIADVLEVLDALERFLGITADAVTRVKATKLAERGPFENVILHQPYHGVPLMNRCAECTRLTSPGRKLCLDCASHAHQPT